MTEQHEGPVIQMCFCPPMADPNDPDQHRAACYHAEVLYRRAYWASVVADTTAPPNPEANT